MKASSYIFSFNRLSYPMKTILFLFTLLSIIAILSFIMESAFERDYEADWSPSDENIDILILGSSQAEAAYDGALLSDLTGLNCVNIAGKGQQPDSTFYVLKDVLEYHTPRTVILDIYWRTLDGNVDISQLIRSYETIENREVKKDFFKEGFSLKNRFEYNFPMLRYRQDFHYYLEKNIEKILEGEFFSKGHVLEQPQGKSETPEKADDADTTSAREIPLINPPKVIDEKTITKENKFRFSSPTVFNERELGYLEKIILLCREREIDLIYTSAPILPQSLGFVRDYEFIHATLDNLAENQGLTYLDYNLSNREGEIVDERHFKDENHMNRLGRKFFTMIFYKENLK